MKKIIFLIISLFVIIAVSGCGQNTKVLTCSGITPGNNMNAASNVKYTFKNDKLVSAKIDVTFQDITVNNLSSVWGTFKTQFTEQNQPVKETGYTRTVKADDKNYTFTVSLDIDYEKISKETMDKYAVSDYRTKTYDEIKEEATANNAMTCK